MAKKSRGKAFVQEFVLLFGFLTGLWIHIGISPEDKFASYVIKGANYIIPGSSAVLAILWLIITIVLTASSIWASYKKGGVIGLIAVALALVGGMFITTFGIGLLLVALIIGFFAVRTKRMGI